MRQITDITSALLNNWCTRSYLLGNRPPFHLISWFLWHNKANVKSRVSFKVDITLPNARQCKGIESLGYYHSPCEARRNCTVAVSRDRDLKQVYPQFLIGYHVAVVNENVWPVFVDSLWTDVSSLLPVFFSYLHGEFKDLSQASIA